MIVNASIATRSIEKNKERLTIHVEALQSKMVNVQESLAAMRTSTNERFDDSTLKLKTMEQGYETIHEKLSSIDMLK